MSLLFRNPNFPYTYSKKRKVVLPPWPEYRTQSAGGKFKEFTKRLPNGRDLKHNECSFWNDYIPALKLSTSKYNNPMIKEAADVVLVYCVF